MGLSLSLAIGVGNHQACVIFPWFLDTITGEALGWRCIQRIWGGLAPLGPPASRRLMGMEEPARRRRSQQKKEGDERCKKWPAGSLSRLKARTGRDDAPADGLTGTVAV